MSYLVKCILSTSLSSLHRNANTGCVVTSMIEFHELGQMMGGSRPGCGSHVFDVHVCGHVMGTSQGTADPMLGGHERRDGCTTDL